MAIYKKIKDHLSSTKKDSSEHHKNDNELTHRPPTEYTDYLFDRFKLSVPSGHPLPHYRSDHLLYDRFLEKLAEKLPARTLVVDVGANIGDTYISMVAKNHALDFICIEPHEDFFSYLKKNTAQAHNDVPALKRPQLIQAFVGATPIVGALISHAGTAQVKESPEAPQPSNYISLSDVLNSQAAIDSRPLLVIKSDVDGFDFNVIFSLEKWLAKQNIILYFECQTNTEQQLESFRECLNRLEGCGFAFDALDNFGNLMLSNANAASVSQILDYVWRQNKNISTRTIWYLDVLATKAESRSISDAALKQHLTP